MGGTLQQGWLWPPVAGMVDMMGDGVPKLELCLRKILCVCRRDRQSLD
jgi:hypothetical protein